MIREFLELLVRLVEKPIKLIKIKFLFAMVIVDTILEIYIFILFWELVFRNEI